MLCELAPTDPNIGLGYARAESARRAGRTKTKPIRKGGKTKAKPDKTKTTIQGGCFLAGPTAAAILATPPFRSELQ